jgi:hypothetical protein
MWDVLILAKDLQLYYFFIYNYEIVFHVNLFYDRLYYVTNKMEYHR